MRRQLPWSPTKKKPNLIWLTLTIQFAVNRTNIQYLALMLFFVSVSIFFLHVMKIRQKILFPVLSCSQRIGKTLKILLCLNCVYHTERKRKRECDSNIVLMSIEQSIVSPYLECKFLCLKCTTTIWSFFLWFRVLWEGVNTKRRLILSFLWRVCIIIA